METDGGLLLDLESEREDNTQGHIVQGRRQPSHQTKQVPKFTVFILPVKSYSYEELQFYYVSFKVPSEQYDPHIFI